MAEKQKSRFQTDYTISKTLGSGSFGVVFSAKNELDEKDYAVKVTFLTNLNVLKEVTHMAKLSYHRNIVQYYTCWKDVMKLKNVKELMGKEFSNFSFPKGMKSIELLCIPMELCSENLREWLTRQDKISEVAHSAMALQMAMGIEHIHCHEIIHRDLKPENIFLSFDNSLKIGDLGLAAAAGENRSRFSLTKGTGTPLYKAPEQDTPHYGKEVDLFAFGLILFELAYPQVQPAKNGGDFERFATVLQKLKYRALLPADFKKNWPRLAGLIERLVDFEVGTRANITDVFKYLSGKGEPVPLVKKAIGITEHQTIHKQIADLPAKQSHVKMVVPPAPENKQITNEPTIQQSPTSERVKKQATVRETIVQPVTIPSQTTKTPAPAPPPKIVPLIPIVPDWPAELPKPVNKYAATQANATPAFLAKPTANNPVTYSKPAPPPGGIPKAVDKQEQI